MQLIPSSRRTPTRSRDDSNGGFPEPPLGGPVSVVRCGHEACGGETWVRIPGTLPESAIRSVICGHCSEAFAPTLGQVSTEQQAGRGAGNALAHTSDPVAAADPVPVTPDAPTASPEQIGAARPRRRRRPSLSRPALSRPALPRPSLPRPSTDVTATAGPLRGRITWVAEGAVLRAGDLLEWLRDRLPGGSKVDDARLGSPGIALPRIGHVPRSRLWAWASVPLAATGVVVGLVLIQGSDSARIGTAGTAAESLPAKAKLIQQPGFSLALPAGWSRSEPPQGAVFAAASDDGNADATLWIEQEPDLSFKDFEKRSLAQLSELAGNARVIDRVKGPTRETTITEMQADAQVAGGLSAPYRVTLRGAGDYLYYFATSLQPGAAPKLAGDAELMHGSLRPEVAVAGLDTAR